MLPYDDKERAVPDMRKLTVATVVLILGGTITTLACFMKLNGFGGIAPVSGAAYQRLFAVGCIFAGLALLGYAFGMIRVVFLIVKRRNSKA